MEKRRDGYSEKRGDQKKASSSSAREKLARKG